MQRGASSMAGKILSGATLLGLLAVSGPGAAAAFDTGQLIDEAMVGAHRSDANKARDRYRHPKETLLYFGLRPDITVVEIAPGRGWYTEILAPVLHDRGQYFAALSLITENTPDALKKTTRIIVECLR